MNVFHSIRFRVTLWYVLVLGLLLAVFGGVMLLLISRSLNQHIDEEVRLRAGHLADIVTAGGVFNFEVSGDFRLLSDEMAEGFDAAGNRVAAAGTALRDAEIIALVPRSLAGESSYLFSSTEEGSRVRVFVTPAAYGGEVLGVIAFAHTTDEVDTVLGAVRTLSASALVLILLLAGAGGFFLTSRALIPVSAISRTASEIGGGDLGRRIQVTDGGEIGALAQTLNQTFDRLQAAFSRERRFTSDASHELRTPLSIIEAEATLALEKNRSADYYKKSLEVVAQEAGHMSGLINDMLFLARSDAGTEKPRFKPVRLGSFMEELVSDISVLSLAKEQTLKFTQAENPVVDGSEARLRQLFLNVLENAIRYTKPGGVITVTVDRREGQAVTGVADTGTGIAADALEHIFEPFFRADLSRAREKGGTGLGLAIGQRIAEAHGGKINVKSEQDKGSTFTVTLPLSKEDRVAPAAPRKKPTRVFKRRRFRFWPFG
jgi:signal transduction histidine kinase